MNRKLVLEMVCGVLLPPFGQLHVEAGQFRPRTEKQMKTDLLETCIASLRKLHTSKHKELDTSVTAELDAVIKQLESCRDDASNTVMLSAETRMRVLEVLSQVLVAVTNIAEVVHKFFGLR